MVQVSPVAGLVNEFSTIMICDLTSIDSTLKEKRDGFDRVQVSPKKTLLNTFFNIVR
tara:strand:+ start:298 stop:468 length:171 start_codon:yes stop_codon:yes gene_type:complete